MAVLTILHRRILSASSGLIPQPATGQMAYIRVGVFFNRSSKVVTQGYTSDLLEYLPSSSYRRLHAPLLRHILRYTPDKGLHRTSQPIIDYALVFHWVARVGAETRLWELPAPRRPRYTGPDKRSGASFSEPYPRTRVPVLPYSVLFSVRIMMTHSELR